MAKKKSKSPKFTPVINTTPTYNIGQELLFHDEKTIMEKVTIEKIQETGYTLSNGIKTNFDLIRNDGRSGHCLILTEELEEMYKAYYAHNRITRDIPPILERIEKMDKMNLSPEEVQTVLRVSTLINKIKSALNK